METKAGKKRARAQYRYQRPNLSTSLLRPLRLLGLGLSGRGGKLTAIDLDRRGPTRVVVLERGTG